MSEIRLVAVWTVSHSTEVQSTCGRRMSVDIIELKTREIASNFLISFRKKLLYVEEPGEQCEEFETVAERYEKYSNIYGLCHVRGMHRIGIIRQETVADGKYFIKWLKKVIVYLQMLRHKLHGPEHPVPVPW